MIKNICNYFLKNMLVLTHLQNAGELKQTKISALNMWIFAVILFINIIVCPLLYSQNEIPVGYPVTLSEKTYVLTNKQNINFRDMSMVIDSAVIKLLIVDPGITGIVGTGKAEITVMDEDSVFHSDTIARFLFRFHPENFNDFMDIENLIITNEYSSPEMYKFYVNSFGSLYHVGKKATIPERDTYGIYCETPGNCILFAWQDKNNTERLFRPNTKEAFLFYRKGKFEEALSSLEVFIKDFPDDAEFLNLYGRVLVHLKRYDEAFPVLHKSIKLNDNRKWIAAWSWVYLGKAYYETGDKKESKAALQKSILIRGATENSISYARNLINEYGFVYDE